MLVLLCTTVLNLWSSCEYYSSSCLGISALTITICKKKTDKSQVTPNAFLTNQIFCDFSYANQMQFFKMALDLYHITELKYIILMTAYYVSIKHTPFIRGTKAKWSEIYRNNCSQRIFNLLFFLKKHS